MAKEDTLQVVSSLGGKEKPVPPLDDKTAGNSNHRMGQILRVVQRRSGIEPNSTEKQDTGSDNGNGKAPITKEEAAPKETSPEKIERKADSSEPPKEKVPKEETPDYWKGESSKHQSRADKAEARAKEIEDEREQLKQEREQLSIYKKQVESFTSDPVNYITQNLPHLAQELVSAGDPLAMVERDVSKVKKELDAQFAKSFGDDWQFNESEALRPGTPSFRYKLAVEDMIEQSRNKYRSYVETKRQEQETQKQAIQTDKAKLAKEFNLTEEDFASVDDWLSKNKVSFYNIAKAVLIDKIIEKRLSTVVSTTVTPPDVSTTGKGANDQKGNKPKISEGGRAVLSRLGRAALAR